MSSLSRFPLGLLLLALVTSPIAAQTAASTDRSSTDRLFVGAGMLIQSLSSEDLTGDDDGRGGVGLGLQIGWGFTPRFAVLIDMSASELDGETATDPVLAHFDLLARYSFAAATRAFVPYIEGGFTGRVLAWDDLDFEGDVDDVSFAGSGLSLGGGIRYFLNRSWSLDANLKWSGGEFSSIEIGDVTFNDRDIDATTTRLTLGFTWQPMANRAR